MTFEDIVRSASSGDRDAEVFLTCMFAVAHVWDDLIDRDKTVSSAELNSAFWLALVDLPANPFYARNFGALRPILANSILNWRIATGIERAGSGGLDIAYILRSSFVDLVTHVALITGGADHAVRVGDQVRRLTHHEGIEGYVHALTAEAAEREGG